MYYVILIEGKFKVLWIIVNTNLLLNDKIQIYDEYLEYGTSVYDIEDQIESELKMSENNYEY